MLKYNSQKVEKTIKISPRSMKMPLLIFKQAKNKLPDKATLTTHKHNKSKKWAKN